MIVRGMSDEDYFSHPSLSQSRLKVLRRPGGAARLAMARYDEAATDAQRFGKLFHHVILQPNLLEKLYYPTTLERRGTKDWERDERKALGRELVKASDYETAKAMAWALRRWQPAAVDLLDGPDDDTEVAFFWTDPVTGLECKGKADKISRRFGAMVDLKSTRDASDRAFARDSRRYGYDFQAAYYLDGWALAGGAPLSSFVVIADEPEPPYLAALYDYDAADLDEARAEIRRLLATYDACVKGNDWPGYPQGLQTLKLLQN